MTHQTSSTASGHKPSGRAFAPVGGSAPKKTPKEDYGKYKEKYQYVMQFYAKNHNPLTAHFNHCVPSQSGCEASNIIRPLRGSIVKQKVQGLFSCETLLRNQPVMQQGCAC